MRIEFTIHTPVNLLHSQIREIYNVLQEAAPAGSDITVHVPDKQIENERNHQTMHPAHVMFVTFVNRLKEISIGKGKDYGKADDPYQNVKAAVLFGCSPVLGVLIRMQDKMNRLQAFSINGALANESVEDSLDDIAVYAMIARVLLQQEKEAKHV